MLTDVRFRCQFERPEVSSNVSVDLGQSEHHSIRVLEFRKQSALSFLIMPNLRVFRLHIIMVSHNLPILPPH
jgi:hypothetical protein